MRRGSLLLPCVGLAVLATAGCIGPFGKRPLTVELVGEARQNLANDRGNAVVIRVYQLSDREKFDRTSLVALWRDETGTLGSALIGKQELTLLPGARETLRIKVAKGTQFVGVVADFISPEAEQWRRVYPVAAVRDNRITLRVGQRQLSVRAGDR
ncbi:MAG: type VI secretion system lipoprotein TssJ [Gemmatimonadaceae bacterium]